MSSDNYVSRFKRAKVEFAKGIVIDGYQAPNGEYRVTLEQASLILGYGKDWLNQTCRIRPKTLEALQGFGFTGIQQKGVGINGNYTTQITTISLDDFNKLILYAVTQKKDKAIALMLSLSKMTLLDFFRDAFGERPLTIDEKRELFYKEYAKCINWKEEDLKDWALIEEQELFLATGV